MTYASRPLLNATRARRGRYGRRVVWVLALGTLLAALGLFAAWTWKAADLTVTNSTTDQPPHVAGLATAD